MANRTTSSNSSKNLVYRSFFGVPCCSGIPSLRTAPVYLILVHAFWSPGKTLSRQGLVRVACEEIVLEEEIVA